LFVFAGSVEVGTIYDWVPGLSSVVSWHASPASLAKARQAPVSGVPASYMQAQHLRGFCEFADRGLDYSRLCVGCLDLPGRCDIRAMTYAINAHLRRHDTYRSWFECNDAKHIVRRTIPNPVDIKFVPTEHGEMTPTEWQDHILSTPNPLNWDCLSFGIIQCADHFTFYVIVDHLHTDAISLAVLYREIGTMYAALVSGAPPISLPPAASHDDYCVLQQKYTSDLSLDSPHVRKWIEFAENNDGSLPKFPLPLGDPSEPCGSDVIIAELMDEQQTARFESACIAAGARFSGGVFACIALVEHQLTGSETYYGITPFDGRGTPAESMTVGWFVGLVPITVPVAASFAETTRAAQASLDSNTDLRNVTFDRVLDLVPRLRRPGQDFTMLNYMDAGIPPFSADFAAQLDGTKAGCYYDGRTLAHPFISVGRLFDKTWVSVLAPDNPIARESVTRYVEAMKSMCVRVAEGHDTMAHPYNVARV
jgi:Condensation domain